MASILGGGKDNGRDLAKKQQEAQQRRSLAELAKQQADVDQASSRPTGRKTGRGLLTFAQGQLAGGDGQKTLG